MRPEPKYNGEIYVNDYVTEEDWQAFTKIAPAPVLEPEEVITPVITQIHW